MSIEVVYGGHDNRNRVVVSADGSVFDFAGTQRMTLELDGLGVVADTDEDASLIDWSLGGGEIEFGLGGLGIAPGIYMATLVAFDSENINGLVLAHPAGTRLVLQVV